MPLIELVLSLFDGLKETEIALIAAVAEAYSHEHYGSQCHEHHQFERPLSQLFELVVSVVFLFVETRIVVIFRVIVALVTAPDVASAVRLIIR